MNDKTDLLPCPFCGDDAHHSYDGYEQTNYVHIGCNSCQCGTAYCETLEHATDIWNTRNAKQFIEQACESIKKEIRDEMDSIDNEIGYSTSHKEGYEYAMERAQQVIKDKFK